MKKVSMTSLMLFLIIALFSQKKDVENTLPITRNTLYKMIIASKNCNDKEQCFGNYHYFAIPETEFTIINQAESLDTLYSFSRTGLTFEERLSFYDDCESAWKSWWVMLNDRTVGKFAIRTKKSSAYICDADQWPIGVCRFIPMSK